MIYAMSDIHGCIEELKNRWSMLILVERIVLFSWEIILTMGIALAKFYSIYGTFRRKTVKIK